MEGVSKEEEEVAPDEKVIKEQVGDSGERSEKADISEEVSKEKATSKKVIKEQGNDSGAKVEKTDLLEEVSKEEEEVAPGEKVIKEQEDDSGSRIEKGGKMGAVGDNLSKVVADALEHLIEEHDYTNTRTWANKRKIENEGGVLKQEGDEEWEDPSRWQFVTVKKSKEMVGSKIVEKLEVGHEVKMSAELEKAAEEIVDDFYADVERQLEFERKVEDVFSEHADVINESAEEDEDLQNKTEEIPKPGEKGSPKEVEKHQESGEVNLKEANERSGLDVKALKMKTDVKVCEDKDAKKDFVMTEDKSREQRSKDGAAFLDCTGCKQSVAVESGIYSCQACEGFRLCTDCKEIGSMWWVGGGCPAPKFRSMPVHDMLKVPQVELSSCGTSTSLQSEERLFPDISMKPDFRSEEDRLASFAQWSVRFIKPADLAKAGFYSLKNLDKCRCAFCHTTVGDWIEGDQPMKEHAKLCPNCPLVLGREVGNVPITWLSAIRKLKEDQVKENQDMENQVKENQVKEDQGKKARKECVKKVKRSRTVGGRVDLRKLMSKEEKGRGCERRSGENESRAVELETQGAEASAVRMNFENQNNNEEHWEELQKLSQRELLEDPDFVPFKPKKPRKSAPPITPMAPAMLNNSAPDLSKRSSPVVSKKSSKKTTTKSKNLTGEVDRVAETRCKRISDPGL